MLQSMYQNPERLGSEKKKIIAEVQGNHLNFKQNVAEKEDFVITKSKKNQPLFSKCRLRAAMFQDWQLGVK